jgi:hypothetical protein
MAGACDPRDYWSVTRVALFPWLASELSPAAVVEALINGIPVVGSDRGALVEALGRAGLILPLPARLSAATTLVPTAAEMAPWIEAILRLWDDAGFYADQRQLVLAEVQGRSRPVAGKTCINCPASPPTGRGQAWVLVPYRDTIKPECERGLDQLEVAGVRVVRRGGCSAIDLARSELASMAVQEGAAAILFIDADLAFDPADALRILARPEPVLAGVYPKKNTRDLACTFADGIDRVVFGIAAPGFYPLKYAATGFLRIRSAVLQQMVRDLDLPLCNTSWGPGFWPFFLPLIVRQGDGNWHYLAEDWAFCHRLSQIGVTPLADTSIRLWHLGKFGFGWEDAGSEVYRYRTYSYFL